uniref:RNase H type-1 domain-containing protein n=1 Tax=Oryza nivara TaxID=4536 RepID=A0A0E0GP00_ORYNI
MKLNIDGSFDNSAEKGGVGAILWDSAGKAIFVSCKPIERCSEALESELRVFVDGLSKAIQWTLLPIVVETDCLTILHLLDSKEKDRSMKRIIQEAKALVAGGDREIVIRKVSRSQNSVSHLLANKARVESCSIFWLEGNCNPLPQLVCGFIDPE